MDLSKYRNKLIGSEDERAVSPVIGVILMVAITVILAAVIAAFVMDIGPGSDTSPQAQYSSSDAGVVDYEDGGSSENTVVTFTVESGESIDADQLGFSTSGLGSDFDADDFSLDASGQLTAGDTIDITINDADVDAESDEIDEGAEFTITWTDGSTSATLTTHTTTDTITFNDTS